MVNITRFWPEPEEIPLPTEEGWLLLLEMRERTFLGFVAQETIRGFLRAEATLSSPEGQEMVRILLYRVLEEFVEAQMSIDPVHLKEELIDAINYLLCIPLIDKKLFTKETLANRLFRLTTDERFGCRKGPIRLDEVGSLTLLLCGELADSFRNRPWMHQVQDVYFSGDRLFLEVLEKSMTLLFSHFDNFSDFASYFIAKDRVLQFRLNSSY